MHKKLLINKLQKIANVLDENNLYKQADQLTLVMKKVAQIDPNSIRDLKIINDKNNDVPNDLLFYAAAVTQGVPSNPLYDATNYNVTLDKINSIASNPYVMQNFPNIVSNIEATKVKLKEKTPDYEQADTSSSSSGTSIAPLSPNSGYEKPANPASGKTKIKLKGIKPLLKTLAKNKDNLIKIRTVAPLIGLGDYVPLLDTLINAKTEDLEKIIDALDDEQIKDLSSAIKNPLVKTFIKENFGIEPEDVESLLKD